ncbi:MAG: aa3-type cytochrome oxidase subunit IV [Acidimicrobiales bacterium]
MRHEAHFLVGVGIFFAVVGLTYWFWGYEQGGTMMLVGTVALGIVPGSYYLWWSHRMKPRPEDREDGSLSEGAGVIGSFPSSSIWPFVFGMGIFLIVLSLVFGIWLAAPGLVVVVSAVIGYSAESRRGGTV